MSSDCLCLNERPQARSNATLAQVRWNGFEVLLLLLHSHARFRLEFITAHLQSKIEFFAILRC